MQNRVRSCSFVVMYRRWSFVSLCPFDYAQGMLCGPKIRVICEIGG